MARSSTNSALPETKPVGIWIRVSTEDQARGESPKHHEARARAYAEAKGWEVRELYDLAGVSGKAVMQHPEAKRMLADIRSGHIKGLIFSKLARLARNTKELLEFSEKFRECNADLISLQETIDTSTPAGRLFFTMIAAMAQWEREEIAERVRASVPIRAKLGKPLSGMAPYGYRWVHGKMIPHPEHAPVRKLMYELYLECRRKKAVARTLNDRGYRSPTGKPWTYTTVNRLLRDTTAKGIYRCNYTQAGSKPGSVVFKPENEWVIHKVEPIVPVELWDQVNGILEEQRLSLTKPGPTPVHLFSGLTFCMNGHKMFVPSRLPFRYRCWTCGCTIPADDLETIYHEQLKGFLFSDEQVAKQQEQLNTDILEKENLLRLLLTERDKVQADMDTLYKLYSAEGLTPKGFRDRNDPLQTRFDELEVQIPAAEASLDLLKVNRLSNAQVLSEARSLHASWPNLSDAQKRTIVETITEKIVIGKENVDIHLHYVPRGQHMDNGHVDSLTDPAKSAAKSETEEAGDKANAAFGLVRGRPGGTTTISCKASSSAARRVAKSSSSTMNFRSSLSRG